MSSMDGDIKKDILDVRKVIERSTSKVSLRDLEKKGFRKVKVLRAGDINQLIYKAVQTVLAKQPAVGMGEDERQKVLAEAKNEYDRQTKQFQELQEASERVEGEKEQIAQAKQNLEKRLAEVNVQLVAERNKIQEARKAFEEEKRQLEREKSTISEKGFDAIQASQKHVNELQDRLAAAEVRANGAVSQDQYNQLHSEARERVSALNNKIEELERALRKSQNDAQMVEDTASGKTRSLSAQLDDSEQRARKLAARVGELEAEVERVRSELEQERLAPKASASGMGNVDNGEIDKLREEMQAQQAQQAQMLAAILGAVKEAPAPVAAAAAAPGGEAFEKSFKAMQQNVMDTLRKFAGSGMKGFDEGSTLDIGALLAQGADVKVETNIKDVGVQTQSAKSVKDKLSKLRSMKGGGPPPK